MYYFQASVRVPADTGADPGFFLGEGCTRLLLYFNTNKPHSFFFSQNTSCIRKSQVISGGGVRTPCTLPLDPPLRHRFCHTVTFSIKSLVFQVKTSHIILCSTIFGMSLCHHVVKLGNAPSSTNGNAIIVLSSKIVPSSMEIVMTSILSEIPVQRLISVFLSFRLQNISFYMRL